MGQKQQAWIGNLKKLLEQTTLERDVENIVNTIINHENIPRKRNKFVNFIKNIMRNKASASSIDKTWDLFSQAQKLGTDTASGSGENLEEAGGKEIVNECVNGDKKTKKKKKKDKTAKQVDEAASDAAMEVESTIKEKKRRARRIRRTLNRIQPWLKKTMKLSNRKRKKS